MAKRELARVTVIVDGKQHFFDERKDAPLAHFDRARDFLGAEHQKASTKLDAQRAAAAAKDARANASGSLRANDATFKEVKR